MFVLENVCCFQKTFLDRLFRAFQSIWKAETFFSQFLWAELSSSYSSIFLFYFILSFFFNKQIFYFLSCSSGRGPANICTLELSLSLLSSCVPPFTFFLDNMSHIMVENIFQRFVWHGFFWSQRKVDSMSSSVRLELCCRILFRAPFFPYQNEIKRTKNMKNSCFYYFLFSRKLDASTALDLATASVFTTLEMPFLENLK